MHCHPNVAGQIQYQDVRQKAGGSKFTLAQKLHQVSATKADKV